MVKRSCRNQRRIRHRLCRRSTADFPLPETLSPRSPARAADTATFDQPVRRQPIHAARPADSEAAVQRPFCRLKATETEAIAMAAAGGRGREGLPYAFGPPAGEALVRAFGELLLKENKTRPRVRLLKPPATCSERTESLLGLARAESAMGDKAARRDLPRLLRIWRMQTPTTVSRTTFSVISRLLSQLRTNPRPRKYHRLHAAEVRGGLCYPVLA